MLQDALIDALYQRITELEAQVSRYENGRVILCRQVDHLSRKLGIVNNHPDADRCRCKECEP